MRQRLAAAAGSARALLLQGLDRARFRARPLAPPALRAVEALERDGAFAIHADDLGLPLARLQPSLAALLGRVEQRTKKAGDRKVFARVSDPDLMGSFPDVLRLGLEDALLDLAEGYLRQRVRYRGALARIDAADGVSAETRCWHRDEEDFRILKAIVYLSDVGPEDGPFEYLPRRLGPHKREVRWTQGRVTDEDMERLVPRESWVACCGRAGTVVLADTCSIWHRGRPPTRSERRALFLAWNGLNPRQPEHCQPMFDVASLAASTDLRPRERRGIGLR